MPVPGLLCWRSAALGWYHGRVCAAAVDNPGSQWDRAVHMPCFHPQHVAGVSCMEMLHAGLVMVQGAGRGEGTHQQMSAARREQLGGSIACSGT